jgi:hypothetical protein
LKVLIFINVSDKVNCIKAGHEGPKARLILHKGGRVEDQSHS